MKIGYARVSTEEQNLSLQKQTLRAAGCKVIIEDQGISGAQVTRPGLADALARLNKGDVLVVWRLDRLGRSLAHLIEIINGIGKAGAGFASLTEAIDTTTAGGRLVFHMMGALAEFERGLIAERTTAGMKAANRRGKHVGRPRKLTRPQVLHAKELISRTVRRRCEDATAGTRPKLRSQAKGTLSPDLRTANSQKVVREPRKLNALAARGFRPWYSRKHLWIVSLSGRHSSVPRLLP